ncbi:MAG: hypothetical protein ACQEQO_08880 [Thermodesulfobacteriota bacterium]
MIGYDDLLILKGVLTRALQNLTIFLLRIERVDLSEMTGSFRLIEPPARREGCCIFTTYQWGKPRAPI